MHEFTRLCLCYTSQTVLSFRVKVHSVVNEMGRGTRWPRSVQISVQIDASHLKNVLTDMHYFFTNKSKMHNNCFTFD